MRIKSKMEEGDRIVGKHVFGEIYGFEESTPEELKKILLDAANIANMRIVEALVYEKPTVYGAVVLVEESHLAIHVYREYSYGIVDIYTCGEKSKPELAYDFVVDKLKPLRYTKNYADRSST
ncbi:MAG: adenosylmethionine decarboxylase [Sulfolobales archaeon]|nr:adenosylmethionine decarboxylase [Sulfolobales archaeon]MDW8083179.1 adenosylmethionine decarboxylase [Sulfolobales archaeon]